jgi:hypothetical protein
MMPRFGLFYVQDELYAAGAWMRRSGDVQDELYAAGAWMRRSGDVQNFIFSPLTLSAQQSKGLCQCLSTGSGWTGY